MRTINSKLIVFESNPDFSDNPRGLYEYIKNNTDYQCFWIIKDEKMIQLLKDNSVDCAVKGSAEAEKMIQQAHYLVSSSFEFAMKKRSGQIHISAWHGFPLKLIGFFDSATDNEVAFNDLKIITTKSDIITASSKLSQLTMAGMFAVDPRKVKDIGFPRNDFINIENAKNNLKKITDIDIDNSKLIFYLPTMRKGLKTEGEQFEKNIFNYDDYDADAIDRFLEKENAYIFAKVHFADNEFYQQENFKLPKRLVFLNTEKLNYHFLTIYHIMAAFDVLLTDYSSVYVDFLLLNRPIIFSCPDMDVYKKDRGFVIDDPAILMPGAIVKKQENLLSNLKDIFSGKDLYKNERLQKMPIFHRYVDSKSSERLFQEMMKVDKAGVKDSSRDLANYYDNTSVYKYGKEGKYEVFFDTGMGFNEIEKYSGRYAVEDGEKVHIELTLPAKTRNVRFDPDDTGRISLKQFQVFIDGSESEYGVLNGGEIDNNIVFKEVDPQIIIPIEQNGKNICIEYICEDFLAIGGKKLIEKNLELIRIKESSLWKIMEVFNKIKLLLNRH